MEGAAQQGFNVDTDEPDEPVRLIPGAEPPVRKQWALMGIATALLLMGVVVFGFGDKTQGPSEQKHATKLLARAFIGSPGITIATTLRGQNTVFSQQGSRHGHQPFPSMVSKTDAEMVSARGSSLQSPFNEDEVRLARRRIVAGVLAGTSLVGAPPAVAADKKQVDAKFIDEAGLQLFVGRYTDPINHPGGIRDISLKDARLADVKDSRLARDVRGMAGFRLAEVKGGGGMGEPASYTLPAMVGNVNGREPIYIYIDFTPKGGPRDFVGVMDTKDGKSGIRFLKDNNFWPKQ